MSLVPGTRLCSWLLARKLKSYCAMTSGPGVIEAGREHLGWILHEFGRSDADHSVLLLPGALSTPVFYDDVLAEPSIRDAPIRFVATTLPGFGGTTPPTT